jgi:hypothetical protein
VMLEFLKDDTEVYKQFVQNESLPALHYGHGLIKCLRSDMGASGYAGPGSRDMLSC